MCLLHTNVVELIRSPFLAIRAGMLSFSPKHRLFALARSSQQMVSWTKSCDNKPKEVYTEYLGLSSPNYGILQGVCVKKPGPVVNRGKLSVLGKYLDDALILAGMSQSELARQAGLHSSSFLSRVMKGEREVDRRTLLQWCRILNCPDWLEECILNAASYASERQKKAVEAEDLVEQTHQSVLEEVARRRKRGI